jgi:hypothetical protein
MYPWHLSSVALGLALLGSGTFAADPLPPKSTVAKAATPTRLARLNMISDWNTFIQQFRRAVQKRDRTALQSAMDDDFFYTFERTHKNDARKQALGRWDSEGAKAWLTLEKVLSAGHREDSMVPGLKVSPPAWVSDDRYTGYRAGFTKVGPYWRWIWFVSGDG